MGTIRGANFLLYRTRIARSLFIVTTPSQSRFPHRWSPTECAAGPATANERKPIDKIVSGMADIGAVIARGIGLVLGIREASAIAGKFAEGRRQLWVGSSPAACGGEGWMADMPLTRHRGLSHS